MGEMTSEQSFEDQVMESRRECTKIRRCKTKGCVFPVI
jgi:hypothetical protein